MPQVERFLGEYGTTKRQTSIDVPFRMRDDLSGVDIIPSGYVLPRTPPVHELGSLSFLYGSPMDQHQYVGSSLLPGNLVRFVSQPGPTTVVLVGHTSVILPKKIVPLVASLNPDSDASFLPSSHLVALIERYSTTIEQEPLDVERESEGARVASSRAFGSPECIGDTVEGLLANLARRSALEGSESLTISRPGRLLPEICEELVYQLGLDAYHPRPVLDCLCKELVGFISEIARERSWGTLTIEKGCIVLLINSADALHIYDPDDADPSMWTVGT